eukprot:9416468-Pyramimonas_sp.AAC.2
MYIIYASGSSPQCADWPTGFWRAEGIRAAARGAVAGTERAALPHEGAPAPTHDRRRTSGKLGFD